MENKSQKIERKNSKTPEFVAKVSKVFFGVLFVGFSKSTISQTLEVKSKLRGNAEVPKDVRGRLGIGCQKIRILFNISCLW